MPRVHTRTKSARPTKRPYICTGCGKEIQPDERYYTWAKRYGGPRYRHTTCGYPRATELSDRKTAVIEDAVRDAGDALDAWKPEDEITDEFEGDSFEITLDEIEGILSGVADEADNVGEEYTSGADNMPDALYYSPTAEAMREVGQELETWASEIRDFSPSSETTVYADDQDEFDERDEWLDDLREKVAAAADEIRQEAASKLEDIPEFQG